MKTTFNAKEALSNIPHKPGVYQYFDQEGNILYVGKAKDLRNRVASYFVNLKNLNNKTRRLVHKIRDIKFTIVENEYEALLLENNLIKAHQPPYNVLLKDDWTYPSIVIKKEEFPRVFSTQQIIRDGSHYYGPYTSLKMVHTMLEVITALYPLRTCALNLSDSNIKSGKYKTCLEYQIGNCKGPCEGLQSKESYEESISAIKNILKGNTGIVIKTLKEDMATCVQLLNFEEAHQLKNKLELLEKYESKSAVVTNIPNDVDVCSIASNDKYAFVNYLKVHNGHIIQTQTIELKKCLEETDAELLELAIIEFRNRFKSNAREIILPFPINITTANLQITIPKQGDKKKLLDLSEKNTFFFKKQKIEQYDKINPELRTERILGQLQKDLHLSTLPKHIECFDNSNFQGSYPVSAMVVFKNAKPSKKDYRHFNVKTVEGPNDFDTMKEVIRRRYSRLIHEQEALPDLIIVDGGKGQLSSAVSVLKELGLYEKIPIIGIAKKLEEIFFPHDSIPLYLDKRSESLKIIQQLRDEAHRFGITHHRNQRDKATLTSELYAIPSIGKQTADKLLQHFRSIQQIEQASEEELLQVVNKKQAQQIKAYFGNNQ